MNKKSIYKTCVVPQCKNTSVTAPDKLFISLPSDQKTRRAWQRAMRRTDFVSDKGSRYCCEDHFNVKEDIENYMYIKTMKTGRIKVKAGVIPHIFYCQQDRTPLHTNEQTQQKSIENCTHNNSQKDQDSSELESVQDVTASKETFSRGVQVMLKPCTRSMSTQCNHESFCKPLSAKKRRTPDNVSESPQRRKKKYLISQSLSLDATKSSSKFSVSTEGSTSF